MIQGNFRDKLRQQVDAIIHGQVRLAAQLAAETARINGQPRGYFWLPFLTIGLAATGAIGACVALTIALR